jgi:hypothetical protein
MSTTRRLRKLFHLLDHFAAKNSDVTVLGFFLIPHGEEMRDEEAFVCNRRVGKIRAAASCEELEPKDRFRKLLASDHTPAVRIDARLSGEDGGSHEFFLSNSFGMH